ncbi:MAG: hypothetical protein QM831_34195 [Kofleriaceae bacterium]
MRGVLWLGLLIGCDSLASNDYVGESLFSLDGAFLTASNAPEDPLGGVALYWQDPAGPGGPGVATTIVPVALAFPTSFHVDIPVPPPAVAKWSLDPGIDLAEAYIYVVETGSRPVPRGSERTRAVIWASADVAAGTASADYLGGPITAGYHLRTFAAATTAGAAQTQMIDRCVASGALPGACEIRRAYQLSPADDHGRLAITVSPP